MKVKLIKEMLKDPKTLIKIKVGVALGGLAAILVILLVVAAALLAPIRAGVEVFENASNATSAIMEKLGNFFTLRGWKTDKEAEEQDERDFYNELENVKQEFSRKYGIEIDTDLILATIFYGESIKDYLDIYEVCNNPNSNPLQVIRPNRDIDCSQFTADPTALRDWKTAKKQIKVLASYQVADNYYQYDQGGWACDDMPTGIYLVGRDIPVTQGVDHESQYAWQVAKNDGDFTLFGITFFHWEQNIRYYRIFVPKIEDEFGNMVCPPLADALNTLGLRSDHIYSLEVDEGHERTEPTGVYYWNLVDEPNTESDTRPSFIDGWYEDYLKSAPEGVTLEERKKELTFNIYEFVRAGLADHYAYRSPYSGVGEENFGDIDFISRNESIEGLDDAFYTTMSNPFYASGINYGYNPYQCTTYVYGRVSEVLAENGISGNLNVSGHAGNWYSNNLNKGSSGYPSSSNAGAPKAGAIAVFGGGPGGYGHVVFVEKVNSDGTIDISEGNVRGTNNKYGYRYTAGIDPNSSQFKSLYGLNFTGYIYTFD